MHRLILTAESASLFPCRCHVKRMMDSPGRCIRGKPHLAHHSVTLPSCQRLQAHAHVWLSTSTGGTCFFEPTAGSTFCSGFHCGVQRSSTSSMTPRPRWSSARRRPAPPAHYVSTDAAIYEWGGGCAAGHRGKAARGWTAGQGMRCSGEAGHGEAGTQGAGQGRLWR